MGGSGIKFAQSVVHPKDVLLKERKVLVLRATRSGEICEHRVEPCFEILKVRGGGAVGVHHPQEVVSWNVWCWRFRQIRSVMVRMILEDEFQSV